MWYFLKFLRVADICKNIHCFLQFTIKFLKQTNLDNFYLAISRKTFKGALSGLRQFLAIEAPIKMMKNAFYFTLI